ncbi:tumor necrosis factor receptor superfamily member 10B-like [Lampris incognitus]|uniref:tumor necrosis factor receptor superfamily member 10B-like n=1 Tax=Lampris incognitus TaxID=2546036 RepID=UPI0024B5B0BD|nr:tumor necrosis factor receptor superfamily member 10B-like [Lampris incognitus]
MNFDPVLGKLWVLMALLSFGLTGCSAELSPSSQWSSDDYRNQTLNRPRVCVENQQYLFQGLCCLNCQAGTFVQKACERDLDYGQCLPCEHGQTYTEHSNGMNRCLPCTHCRTDEIETTSCTSTSDTKCQCKSGTFCVPDQACEVCKRCARCKAGEEVVKKCTSISNTVCRKRDLSPTQNSPTLPTPASSSPGTIVILPVVIIAVGIITALAAWWFKVKQHSCKKLCSRSHCDSSEIVKIPIDESGPTAEERQNNQNAGLEGEESRPESRPLLQESQAGMSKASPPLEDEDRGLGDSLPNTTSSSQTSLSALPTAASSGNSPHHSPSAQRLQPSAMDDPLQNRLVPLLGSEKSLRKSFDLFDEYLDVRIHNKFFRMIGVSDNHIRIAESAPPGDKVYDLLKNWMQREGLKADINNLLDALLSLDQRRSAESIAFAALQKGYYKHSDTP